MILKLIPQNDLAFRRQNIFTSIIDNDQIGFHNVKNIRTISDLIEYAKLLLYTGNNSTN